jgi:hypothetical protein
MEQPDPVPNPGGRVWTTSNNFQGLLRTHKLDVNYAIDPAMLLIQERQSIKSLLTQDLAELYGLKFHMVLSLQMAKTDLISGEQTSTTAYFHSNTVTVLVEDDILINYESGVLKIIESIETYTDHGSNYNVERVNWLTVNVAGYRPLAGGRHFVLPPFIAKKKACINLKNTNNMCFKYNCLLHLNKHLSREIQNNPQILDAFEGQLDFEGLEFPMQINKIDKFEKKNPNVAITIIGSVVDNGTNVFVPLRVSRRLVEAEHRIDMLYINNHYVYINNLNRLLSMSTSRHNGRKFVCRNCFTFFSFEDLLERHEPHCMVYKPQVMTFPEGDRKTLKFTGDKYTLLRPYVCIADFESWFDGNEHKPLAVSYLIFDSCGKLWCPQKTLFGADCAVKFLREMDMMYQVLELKTRYRMKKLTPEQEAIFLKESVICTNCKQSFPGKVLHRHHDYLTGQFLAAVCKPCNHKLTLSRDLVVGFHNGQNYDFAYLVRALKSLVKSDKEIKVLGKSVEHFISISWNHIIIIDTYKLLGGSLATLCGTMQPTDFNLLKQAYPDPRQWKLLLTKMPFPYSHFKSEAVLDETELPGIESYHNDLTNEACDPRDYEKAVEIWNTFGLHTVKDLVKLYVQTDVLQLADVSIRFRNICFQQFEIDPFHFVSLPSFAFSACSKITNMNCDLITSREMYLLWQKAKIGGFTTVVQQYAKSNNPLVPGYDSNQEMTWILYLDCCAMYSTVMFKEKLPVRNMRFLTDDELRAADLLNFDCSGDKGYLVECSLSFDGDEVHDLLADFPPLPVNRTVSAEEQSPRMKLLAQQLGINLEQKTKKLIADLHPRVDYVLPLKSLQFILKTTKATLHKITRAVVFDQEAVLSKFIHMCIEMRKKAKTKFEIDVWKLICNSIYGFSLLDSTKFKRILLVYSKQTLSKLINNPLFVRANCFDENAAAVEMRMARLEVRQPVFLGISILSYSKNLILDFYYNVLKQEYGSNLSIIFSDTDSLCMSLKKESPDIYQTDILPKFVHLMDTSNFDPASPLYTLERKKVMGTFTDECGGKMIQEIVVLKPKSYSIKMVEENLNIVKSKGVPKSCQKELNHEHYKNNLFDNELKTASYKTIGCKRQRLFTLTCKKNALSSYESKRYWLNGSELYKSLPYGHYRINRDENLEDGSV